jgi:hypothetical protein
MISNNINPKICTYGCGLQIYWNTQSNEYWEVFTKKKHVCPNRSNSVSPQTIQQINQIIITNLQSNQNLKCPIH